MTFVEILFVALGLAMDAFAVALAAGATGRARGNRAAFRLASHFGVFQFLMPVIGWFAGSFLAARIQAIDHWVAFALLCIIGTRMVRAGTSRKEAKQADDPSRGTSLILLSIATSIDALAVGLSLAMLGLSIWYPSAVIGVVAAIMTLAGIRIGHRLGIHLGKRMEVVGGIILIAIGVKIVVDHLA